jgi:conjugal transfer pilus assembly protein TraL
MDETLILRRLDDPWKLGLWDLDIALPFTFCVFFGMLRGTGLSLLLGVALGFITARAVSRLKAARHPAYIKHAIYWTLPPMFARIQALPPSAQNEMVG